MKIVVRVWLFPNPAATRTEAYCSTTPAANGMTLKQLERDLRAELFVHLI